MGITVPRITVHADFGRHASLGELSYISVGYGLHQVWIYASMFAPGLFREEYLYAPASDMSLLYVISIIVYGIFLLGYAAFDTKVPPHVRSNRFLVANALIASLGTLCAVLPVQGTAEYACEVAGGVLTGIGSSGLLLAWGIEFSRNERSTIVLNTGVALVIAIVLYALVLHHVPTAVAATIVVAIPLVEMLLLLCRPSVSSQALGQPPMFNFVSLDRAKLLVLFGIPVSVFGFALGVLRQTSVRDVIPALSMQLQFVIICAAVGAAVFVVLTLVVVGKSRSWSRNFRILVPVIAVAALFIPASLSESGALAGGVLVMGYFCFEALLWSFFGEFSQEFNVSPVFVFGVGRGAAALTALFGTYVLSTANPVLAELSIGDFGLTAFVLVMVVLAYALLPDEREVRRLVVPCPVVNFDLEHDTAVQAERPEQETSSLQEPKESDEGAQAAQPEQPEQPAAEAAAVAHEERESRPADDAGETPGRRMRGWFKANCELISSCYLLSRRETEVLFLLAKGYNAAYIQEKLYISEGTAKTHIRHIYRKVGVHSQQELMRMVEEADKAE